MDHPQFRVWCHNATHKILFPPDREAVSRELYDHMTDRFEALLALGLSEEEACTQTLRAMGNAIELAPLLAQVHTPFWGYFHRFTRIVLALLVLLCLSPIAGYLNQAYDPRIMLFDPASPESDAIEATMLSLHPQDDSFRAGSTRYRLQEASIWIVEKDQSHSLDFVITQTNGNLWGFPESYYRWTLTPISWCWAEDNLGNYYYSPMESDPGNHPDELCLHVISDQTGLFTYTHEFYVLNFPAEDVQWLRLHFQRDGRDYTLTIDLQGGDWK